PTDVVAEPLGDALERARNLTAAIPDDEHAEEGSPPAGIPSLAELVVDGEPQGQEPIPQMLRALREEMRAVDRKQPKRFRLSRGRCVRGAEGRFVYQFVWSSEPDSYTPGELLLGETRIEARVGDALPGDAVRQELVVEEWLGPTVDSAVFRVDPTFLLRVVYMGLKMEDDSSPDVSHWAARLALPPSKSVTLESGLRVPDAMLNEKQRDAVAIAASVDRAYVWGPPGTGKTTTIGALARLQAGGNRRVLILSPYNVAVDEAIKAIATSDAENLKIVRVGRAGQDVRRRGLDMESQLEEFAAGSGLLDTARRLLAALSSEPGEQSSPPSSVRACLDDLGALVVKRQRARNDPEAKELVRTIRRLRRQFRAPEADILAGAA
ncbi:MAG TPA: AAA domain-containing protein, partial [Gemmatimonadaceae bacterium]